MQATQIVDSAGEAVVETHATPVNWSLQLTGRPGGFSWEGTYDGVMIILTRFFSSFARFTNAALPVRVVYIPEHDARLIRALIGAFSAVLCQNQGRPLRPRGSSTPGLQSSATLQRRRHPRPSSWLGLAFDRLRQRFVRG